MSKLQGWLILVLLAAMTGIAILDRSRVDKWDYTIVSPEDERLRSEFFRLGDEGWELVTARRATGDGGASYEMILKRPR